MRKFIFRIDGEGNAVLTGYRGDEPVASVPAEYKGHRVTEIAQQAFARRNELIDVILPAGVAKIGRRAFACCERLTSLVLPGSVTAIDDLALEGCNDLTLVVRPDSPAEDICITRGLPYARAFA